MRILSRALKNLCKFIKFPFYFYIISILSIPGLVLFTNGDSGWLRVCDSDSNRNLQHYEIQTDSCPHGAWLSDPISSGCVCLNGLWAVGQNWCDEDYRLLLGKGHCFKLEGDIRKLAYVGNPDDFIAPTNFMTKRNGHVFKPFNDTISNPYEYELNYHGKNINKTILRFQQSSATSFLIERTPKGTDSYFDDSSPPLCLQSPEKESYSNAKETALFVYKIREAIKNLQIIDNCPIGAEIHAQVGYDKMSILKILPGESLHVKSGAVKKSSESCRKSCKIQSVNNGTLIRRKRSSKSKSKSKKDPKTPEASNTTSDRSGYSADDRQRLINEETVRIVKTEVMWLMERKKPPRHNNTNWRLLQKAKEAFAKVCPKVETPKFLVNAMLRLFRIIYLHSKDFNPFGHFYEEQEQNVRIANSLDACIVEGEEIKFDYVPEKMNTSECIGRTYILTDKNESFCPCTESLEMINLNYTKTTMNPHELFKMNKTEFALPTNYSYMMIPKSESFNGSNRDFPIETTWKIVSFAHYYCAKYFKQNPADHSALLVKMESFFNSEIIYRWNHPGLRTNETWQSLYSSFNMQKFADSVDACVAAAKHVSEYPEWIIRPSLDTIQRKKRSLDSQEIRSGKAFCLQDPWDPVEKLGVTVADECYEWNNL